MVSEEFYPKENLKLETRFARPNDWAILKELRMKALTGEDAPMLGVEGSSSVEKIKLERLKSQTDWVGDLNDPNKLTVLTWNKSEAVGMLQALKQPNSWYIHSVYVLKDFQGMSIGKKMFKLILEEIKKKEVNKVSLGVKANNARMITLAKIFGFVPEENIKKDSPGFFMHLDLSKEKNKD